MVLELQKLSRLNIKVLLKDFWAQSCFVVCVVFVGIYYLPNSKPDTIILGQTCPLTGQAAALGVEMMHGANSYFRYINENGGIRGKKIKLITLDDKYEPNIAKRNVELLIKQEKAIAIFGAIGTPTGQKTLGVAMENNTPFLTPFTGAKFLREPFNRLVINLRPSYKQEIKALLDYLKRYKKTTKIAVFYQNDSFGIEGLYAVKSAIGDEQIKIVSTGSFNRNTLSVQNAMYEISLEKPDAVILIAPYEPSAEFIKRSRNNFGLRNVLFCPISFTGVKSLQKELGGQMQNIIASQVFPNPNKSNKESVRLYRELYKKEYPDAEYSYTSLEGFLSAMLTVKALEKAKSFDSNGIISAFERLKKDSIDGFEINLSHLNHQAIDEVYIEDFDAK